METKVALSESHFFLFCFSQAFYCQPFSSCLLSAKRQIQTKKIKGSFGEQRLPQTSSKRILRRVRHFGVGRGSLYTHTHTGKEGKKENRMKAPHSNPIHPSRINPN